MAIKRERDTVIRPFHSKINKSTYTNNFVNYKTWLIKTMIRIGICTFMILIVLFIQWIGFEKGDTILSQLKIKLDEKFDITNYYSFIKDFGNKIAVIGDKALEAVSIENVEYNNFMLPTEGQIETYFNENIEGSSIISKGLIFSCEEGTNITATANGVVIEAGSNKAIGNYIIIKHKGELISAYKRLGEVTVKVNDRVEKGQKVGIASQKLILETWFRNEPVDPLQYIEINRTQL